MVEGVMQSEFEISIVTIGHVEGYARDVEVLNRFVIVSAGGIKYETYATCAELIIRS